MKIPKRPAMVSTTLQEHADLPDAPVFYYEPPLPADGAGWLDDLFGMADAVQDLVEAEEAAEAGVEAAKRPARTRGSSSLLRAFCELFDRQIRRIDPLEIDDEPFDPAKHLDDIPASWKIAVGKEIFGRIKQPLTGPERGN